MKVHRLARGLAVCLAACLGCRVAAEEGTARAGEVPPAAATAPGAGEALLANPGFELLDEQGDFAAKWGRHYLYKGEFKVIIDPRFAHGGSACVSVAQTGPEANPMFTTLGSQRIVPQGDRRYTVSVWVRGKGELSLNTYYYAQGPNVRLGADGHDFSYYWSPWQALDADAWRQLTFAFTVPLRGHTEAQTSFDIDAFEFLFNVKGGPICFDDVDIRSADAAPQTGPEPFFDARQCPLLTLTRMPAPEVDGVVNDDEWRLAAVTTGLKELNGPLAARQTLFYAGYDDTNLYVAFSSRQDTAALGMGPTGRRALLTNDAEGVEIWLQPPNRPALQFLGVPAGGFLTDSPDRVHYDWGPGVRFASQVCEGTEMAGRIMTMGYKVWSGEVVIPFADLGVAAPQSGDVWRANFCRDFTAPNYAARENRDWTTWAPISTVFANTAEFGYARFDAGAPPFRLLGLGELGYGKLAVAVSGARGMQVSASVELDEVAGKKVVERQATLAEDGLLTVSDAIRSTQPGVTGMELKVAAKDARGALAAQNRVRFSLLPTFWIRPRLLLSAKTVRVEVDVSRSVLPKGATAEVGIRAPGAGGTPLVRKACAIEPQRPTFSLPLDIAGLAPGRYTLTGVVLDADGKETATTAEPLTLPEPPAWLGNRLGYSDRVPPPFTPVQVDGRKVSVVLREYSLADSGLPAAITAKGLPLLSRPVELRAVVNGARLAWEFAPLQLVANNDREASFRIHGTSTAIELTGTLTLEFDGFATWRVALTPRGTPVLESLQLVAPVRSEHALFARGDGFLTASLLQDRYSTAPGREDVITLGNAKTEWGSWSYSRKGWVWPETFCNEVYVGDESIGFSLMTEGAKDVIGTKYADFLPSADGTTTEMVVNLVSRPTTLAGPLGYTFCYQTMPMRPEPKDPRMWHVGYDPNSVYSAYNKAYQTPEAKAFLSSLQIGQAYYDLIPDGYPKFAEDARARQGLRYFQELGMKVTHNLWWAAIADSLPEYALYGTEWEALPRYGWSTPVSHLSSACENSAFQDFFVWCAKGIVDDLGFDGFYTDATPVQCSNELHGCGYVDADGKRQPTLNLLATRNFVKRMYTILKEDGKDRVNFNHSGEGGAVGAFADVRTHGEELCWEGKDHYRRITPDFIRARYAQNENGAVYTFLPIFYFSWRKVGEATPLSEALMISLAHRVGLTIAWSPEIVQVWKVFDPWWTSAEFIPYWRQQAPVVSSAPAEVTVSTFLKRQERRALVEVSNWTYGTAHVQLLVDRTKLGFDPRRVALIDIPSGTTTALDLDNPSVEVKERNFQALLID